MDITANNAVEHSPNRRWFERDDAQQFIFIAPTVIFLLLISIFPFVYSVYLSLHDVKLTRLHRKVFIGIENYIELFRDDIFVTSIQNTALLTIGAITIEVLLGFAFAKVFMSFVDVRGSRVMRSLATFPMMMAPLAVAFMANYILNPTIGIVTYLLSLVGLPPIEFLAEPALALPTITLIVAWQWTPFMMLLILAGLHSIPGSLYEAAALENAKWYHIARWIELPAIRDIIIVGIILRVIENLKLFDIVYVLTRGGPGDATEILTFFAYRTNFRSFQIGYGAASAVIILIISIIVTTIAVTYMRRVQND